MTPWDQLSPEAQQDYMAAYGWSDAASAAESYNREVAAGGPPVSAPPSVGQGALSTAAMEPAPTVPQGALATAAMEPPVTVPQGALATAAMDPPPTVGQGVLGTAAPLQAPPLVAAPVDPSLTVSQPPAPIAGGPTTAPMGQPTGQAINQATDYNTGGGYTGGGSGGSAASTGGPAMGTQSDWSRALHASGALQDPRANPIPFDQHPQMQGMSIGSRPQVGSAAPAVGQAPLPMETVPGMQMNSPALPVAAPPAVGGGGQPLPGSQVMAPTPPPMPGGVTSEQAAMMAAQMNDVMRKRYGGY